MSLPGARDLVIDSVTGVELAFPIAGPGARCYAFLIDWTIRAILFTAWYAIAALIYNGRWSFSAPLNPDATWFMLVVAPAACLYFLYHFVLEIAMHGRTPGKRIAGVHLVSRDGGPPSVAAILIRNVFRLVDSLPVLYGIGLITTLLSREHVRVGDMAAGTLLTYERDTVLPPPDRSDIELISELLLRWDSLEELARRRLATALLNRHGIDVSDRTDTSLRERLNTLAQGCGK